MIREQDWAPADGLQLEPNALAAVREVAQNLAVTAGPGAGKSELLAQRADFLLRTGNCPYPQRILAIAFKVDASKNLRERVRKRCGPELAARFDSHTFHAFARRVIDRFRAVLTGADELNADYTVGKGRIHKTQLDYDDLIPLATFILRTCPAAKEAVRQTYTHVFLDEFQDCTDTQYKFIKEAFGGTHILLTAVGDTKQLIMGWAGALVGIFATYAQEFSATALNLYLNFRSLPRLRRMQNEMVKVMDPKAAVAPSQLKGNDGEIHVLHFKTAQDEGAHLAGLIKQWLDEGLAAQEIAVLVTRQPHLYAEALMRELTNLGVPYRNEQEVQDLTNEPITRLIVDYLACVWGEREPEAYGRTLDFLLSTAIDEASAGLLFAKWHASLDTHRAQVRANAAASAPTATEVRRVCNDFLTQVGLERLTMLSAEYQNSATLAGLVKDLLAHIDKLLAQDPDVLSALRRLVSAHAVRILTVHKCKGLEFDTVVVLGVEEPMFRGIPHVERPIFFVAISRAKRRLFLTTSENRPRPKGYGGGWNTAPAAQTEFLNYVVLAK